MPISESATPAVDPRVTAYLQKHPLKIAPLLHQPSPPDPRIVSYITKYPLQKRAPLPPQSLPEKKPIQRAVSSIHTHPLFRPRRRSNLFVQTPAPKPHPVPEPPAPPSIPQPNSQEVPELSLPFYEGQMARIRSSGISGMVVYV